MRHLLLYPLLAVAADYTLPTLVNSKAVPDDAPATVAVAATAEVKVAIIGRIDLTADRGHKVFIGFLASPKLTAAARASLVSSNFELVDIREQADTAHELDGVFQALHPTIRCTAEVRVSDYAENSAPLTTESDRGGSVVLSLNPLAMPIGTIAPDIGNAVGAQDSMNAATASNPDGKCLSRCETWRYRQRNVINPTRKEGSMGQKCSVLTTAKDAELVPVRLIQSSLADLRGATGLIVTLGLSTNSASAK